LAAKVKSMTKTNITITGKTWDEERVGEVEGAHAVARATFTTEWAGEIAGTSTCWLLISYVDGDPDKPETLVGPYTGYELVTATIGERSGTFVLAAKGAHTGGVARTEVSVVEGSGTGELAGIRGSGSYAADAMEYVLELDYEL
jgi:predicted ATP-dependent Lon-type protease